MRRQHAYTVIALLAAVACSRNQEQRGAAAEITSLMLAGQKLTYHATYKTVGPLVPRDGSLVTEAWRKGELTRVDQTMRTGGRAVQSAIFHLESRIVSCNRRDEGRWNCERVPQPSPVAGTSRDPIVGQIEQQLQGKRVEARTRTVAGHRARCFRIGDEDERSEVCLTTDGIPVRYTAGRASQVLTDLEREVKDGVFVPPSGG